MQTPRWPTALFLLLALGSGCGEEERPRPALEVGDHGLRLVDVAVAAAVDGPLTEVDAAPDPLAVADIARTELLLEGFEAFDFSVLGWKESAAARVEPVDGDAAFVLRDHDPSLVYGWSITVQPNTYYVFSRRIRSAQPVDWDFSILEAPEAVGIESGVKSRNFIAGYGKALKVHWPAAPVPDGTWQEAQVALFTSAATNNLTVFLRPAVDSFGPPVRDREICFDDITVHQLSPTPAQAVALLKARHNVPDERGHLDGLVKRGQFPPMVEMQGRHGPGDRSFAVRDALYAPTPTDLSFRVTLPAGASLRFGAALARESELGSRAQFAVVARQDGQERELWTRTVAALRAEWVWNEHRVDLTEFEGQTLDLVLRTTAAHGVPQPVWGTPEIVIAADNDTGGEHPRNVILIAVDTLRADRLSCYGYRRKTSPHIDALAADGVRFDQVAANANWTCPSFASILTGVLPSRHNVFGWGATTPLPRRLDTLAERFRREGFATSAIVYKAPLYDAAYDQGFDVFFNVPRAYQRGDDNLAEALDWLDRHADRRNFLFLHFNDPHQPFTQPGPFQRKFGANPSGEGYPLPYFVQGDEPAPKRRLMRLLYDGEVLFVDHCIGKFLDALRDRGLYDDAVIALLADHGEALWEHDKFGHGKGFLRDSVARVPLIIKPSGAAAGFARGTTIESQVLAFDVMPTLLELAGLPVEGGTIDAQSLVPLLAPDPPAQPDRIAVVETSLRALAVRTSQWKYILRFPTTERLYDLAADPREATDVSTEHASVTQELRRHLLDYLMQHRPGRYVVVLSAEAAAEVDLTLRGPAAAGALFGLRFTTEDGALRLTGSPRRRLASVARIGDDAVVELERDGATSPLRAEPYPPDRLQELLEAGTAGVFVFDGPPPPVDDEPQNQSLDLQQLEALKALGYAGGK